MLTTDVGHAVYSAEGVAGREWAWLWLRHAAPSSSISLLRESDLEESERRPERKLKTKQEAGAETNN